MGRSGTACVTEKNCFGGYEQEKLLLHPMGTIGETHIDFVEISFVFASIHEAAFRDIFAGASVHSTEDNIKSKLVTIIKPCRIKR